ncbi:hypothetical protein Bca4012_095963 [Brassica carinata]|uniref:Uncharacterized protein n=2 Tax=Brassica TaxID=3705 RepID=A0A3P6GNM9_BRAOL|nr:unnamed protein product [Brassica napus]CDY67477.1 BnaCnng55160D [Brassica napus]VDD58125.1 unnamed protein product [Brassica oleracea]
MIMLRIRSRDGLERVVQGRVVRDGDPKLSKMKKEVIVGVKDLKEVDDDFFLVVTWHVLYQGSLSCTFPIENRNIRTTVWALETKRDRPRRLPFVKRISDFHLLLFVAQFLFKLRKKSLMYSVLVFVFKFLSSKTIVPSW